MSTTTEVNEVVETPSTDEASKEAVEAPEAPLSAAQEALKSWSDLSPRLFRQDQALIAWLEENGSGTEKVIRVALPQLSSWSFRRLATGVHHKAQRGDPIIEKVKREGVSVWQLAERFRSEVEQPVEDDEVDEDSNEEPDETSEPAEAPASSGRSRRSRSGS